ncbi:MAG: molybdopterin biosynthesis protein [ANME-2 cluster archaeon]|nr:molybdopterin biosynthesis protein [ANME-2 cluster archaeon]
MDRKEFRELTSSQDARCIISKISLQPDIIDLKLAQGKGRVLACDIIASVDVPGFDRASMDGYAVRARDTYTAREDRPVKLHLTGKVETGYIPDVIVSKDTAVEISTGAMMPEGADAVVMVEYTRSDKKNIDIQRPVSVNENVIHAGSDIMVGERVLEAGTRLTSREIGVLAAVGMKQIPVKDLIVGLISTGSELVEPGAELTPGTVYDINSYSLGEAVSECGGSVKQYGIVKDHRPDMEQILARAVNECHLVLTSGSTSAGVGDVMYHIIAEQGELLLHGIDIKPGKPVIIGIIDGTPVFGLPGYPASALTIFNEFTAPLIRSALGLPGSRSKVMAHLAVDFYSAGRRQLLPVGLVRGMAYPVDKGSGAISTLAHADGFIEIEPLVEMLAAGDEVEVILVGDIKSPDVLFIGSHCLGFEALMRLLPFSVRMINTGSTGGLVAIRDGIADMAGVHLLDDAGEYNISFMKRFGLKNAVLIKGYLREQGLIVRPDSSIQGLEDISAARFINRTPGSGTRVLTDIKLRELANAQGRGFEELCASIEGYDTQARTHSAVAAAVKLKRADVGIGIRSVAQLNGLKFIHLANEEYDFVVKTDFINSELGMVFLDMLHSKELSSRLPAGIKTYERTGEIVISGRMNDSMKP